MTMPSIDLNWLAILVAALSSFALGALWYGPLFKRTWCREAGIDLHALPAHPARIFATALLCSLFSALMFSVFLGPTASAADGFGAGFVVGVFFVAMSFGINYAFSQRSVMLWMIDSGYHVLQFCLYGLILGAWR
ncbi:DUF1761 domain-containing protein [Cognatilysobacter bugurensis]|uniref:DUF1761 domain-containing protein n=1 Tax=Cognatilysobacter bugurensis TaxID=543356 RepID=A0A918SY61_9GAMM|nr:DUF1761 domain-containing protein [Lysobacter bugurensis]GHA78563.1 hypothetical protein GCM10007067_14780 [Lysobacter bugurensis]